MAAEAPNTRRVRLSHKLVGAALVLLAAATPALATPPSVEQMLNLYKPRQDGIDFTTPTKEEFAQCEVKLETGKAPGSSGWVLFDAKKQPVRKFFAANGKNIDMWSYYKDGVEIYRELDTNGNGKPDQYRWLNTAGTKWGIDANEDGKIDSWRMISAEETAQEAYLAVVTRDFSRLQMLFVTEQELAALRLSETHTARIRESGAKAQAKFQSLCAKATNLNSQAKFAQVETAVPQCVPADSVKGPGQDLLRFPTRAVMYDVAPDKHEWLHTGEMILVGQTWRLTDAPSVGEIVDSGDSDPTKTTKIDEGLKKLMDDLMALDKNAPPSPGIPGQYKAVVEYNTKRVALLEQISAKMTDAKEKENWLRQILDNLCTGHQANEGDNTLLNSLGKYKSQIVQSAPGSNLAGYAHYREMWARFSFELFKSTDPIATQRKWTDELAKFVAAYPRAEDAADALRQLAVNSEYGGKDKQEEAKKYWGLIISNFPEHPVAPLAKGALKRLELVGRPMELTGPTLQGSQFDLSRLNGKVVAVYYWAKNCSVCVGDFAVMKQMQATYAAKGLEIVTVNLDEASTDANAFLASNPLPATHLFLATETAKGLESPLAVQYGIVGVPTLILVGKDGRVIDRSLQINELEEAVKKAL